MKFRYYQRSLEDVVVLLLLGKEKQGKIKKVGNFKI